MVMVNAAAYKYLLEPAVPLERLQLARTDGDAISAQ